MIKSISNDIIPYDFYGKNILQNEVRRSFARIFNQFAHVFSECAPLKPKKVTLLDEKGIFDVIILSSDGHKIPCHFIFVKNIQYIHTKSREMMHEIESTSPLPMVKEGYRTLTFAEGINSYTINLFLNFQYELGLSPSIALDELIDLYELADFLNHKDLVGIICSRFVIILKNSKDVNRTVLALSSVVLFGDSNFLSVIFLDKFFESLKKCEPETQQIWIQNLTPLAENDPTAMNYMGYCYDLGIGLDIDPTRAVAYYKEPAGKGNWMALINLGMSYENGTGVEKDADKAFEYYTLAASQDNPKALLELARCHRNQIGTKLNKEKSFQLCQLASLTYPRALANLGWHYAQGIGVAKNLIKAFECFSNTADTPLGQFYLGMSYEQGISVEKNIDTAIKYYTLAADGGIPAALEQLRALQHHEIN